MKFQVITRVGDGQVAAAFGLHSRQEDNTYRPVAPVVALIQFAMPVWTLGEVVIVGNHDGRELVGAQRKASKWDVDVETFDTIEEAVARAIEVTQQGEAMLQSEGT